MWYNLKHVQFDDIYDQFVEVETEFCDRNSYMW